MTLHRAPNTLLVTMNRDEALTRGPEVSPERHNTSGAAWIGPRDSDRGGTWMGVNQSGVVACLLNAYRPDEDLRPQPGRAYPSRGAIIPQILPMGTTVAIDGYLRNRFDPSDYPSFTLFVAGLDQAHCYEWYRDGGFDIRPVRGEWSMRTSSGWDSAEVSAWREARFNRWLLDGAPMRAYAPEFHFLREAGAEERSPLMLRSWSSTRSVTQAEVSAPDRRVLLRYWGAPAPGGGEADYMGSLALR